MMPTPLSHRVLVADDDPEIRWGLSDLLGPLGLEVLLAESGAEALEMARIEIAEQRLLHAMVLDIHMPGVTGIQVLQSLRGEIEVPTILCTGRPSVDLERAAREAGAWAFLPKPVRPDLLRSEVQRAITESFGA